MNATVQTQPDQDVSRGAHWLRALAPTASYREGFPRSVAVADGELAGTLVRWIAVVPDAQSRFPRARNGEVGLIEGWSLAQAVREVVEADYGMRNGTLDIPTRARLVTYVLQLLHIKPGAVADDPTAQQIVVENRDELAPWLFG